MSLNDILTAHADAFRQKTGVSNKLSITDMTRLLDDLSWSKTNLLKGTSDEYRTLGNVVHGDWAAVTTSDNLPLDISDNGYKSVTYSATLCNLSKFNVQGEIIFLDINNNRLYDNVSNKVTPWIYPGEMDKELSVTRVVPADVKKIQVDFCAFTQKNPCPIKIKNERLYEGTEPGIWTPNPSELPGGIAEVIQDSTTESVISEYIKATKSNGITTLSSEEGGPNKRCLILADSNSTITDDMMLVMVARKSANSQYDSIDLQIGGFDAVSNLTVSSSNWGLYSVHLKKSKSGTISLYCTEKGNLIDIRYFAVVKTAKYDN